jgi:DNA-binding GntR family transcriptional regulator
MSEPAVLDADSPDPLWRQAADLIRHQIEAGKLADNGRIPAERDLLAQLSISRVTLRRALQTLVEEGVLTASHGRGWYVSADAPKEFPNTLESFSETAARLGLVPSSDVIRAEDAPATLDEAEELGIAPGAHVFHLDRIRRLDGVPVAVDTSYFASSLKPDFTDVDFRFASLFEQLLNHGIDLARGETTIEARAADAALAAHLDIEVGKPILVMRQSIMDGAGKPVLSSVVQYVGDRYRLRTSFSRSRKPGLRG